MDRNSGRLILSVDAGGTGIRAFLMDRRGEYLFQEFESFPAEHPEEGATEYDPIQLWEALKTLLQQQQIAFEFLIRTNTDH